MASMASMTVVVNCDSVADITQCLAQINAWVLANPGKILNITTSGKKITVIFASYEIYPVT